METLTTNNQTFASFDLLKTSTVLGPLFVSSLAVCYDVGFFYGLDPRFFTFFSLSEHLVFALQALPFALIPALWVLSFVLAFWFGDVVLQRQRKKVSEMDLPTLQTLAAKSRARLRWIKIFDPVIKVAIIGLALWLFSLHRYTNAVWVFIGVVIPELISYPLNETSRIRRIGLIIFSISMSWIMAFAMGYEQAEKVTVDTYATEIVSSDKKDIAARLVRGGERGILLFSLETKRFTFLQWNAITKIETLAP